MSAAPSSDGAVLGDQDARDLADRGGLARAVDAHDEHHPGVAVVAGDAQATVHRGVDQGQELLAEHGASIGGGAAVDAHPGAQPLDELLGGADADVGGEQGVLDRLPRVLVEAVTAEQGEQAAAERALRAGQPLPQPHQAGGRPLGALECRGLGLDVRRQGGLERGRRAAELDRLDDVRSGLGRRVDQDVAVGVGQRRGPAAPGDDEPGDRRHEGEGHQGDDEDDDADGFHGSNPTRVSGAGRRWWAPRLSGPPSGQSAVRRPHGRPVGPRAPRDRARRWTSTGRASAAFATASLSQGAWDSPRSRSWKAAKAMTPAARTMTRIMTTTTDSKGGSSREGRAQGLPSLTHREAPADRATPALRRGSQRWSGPPPRAVARARSPDPGADLTQPLADHRGDAVAAHGHAVERVADLHRALLVGDDQELRVLPELLVDLQQPARGWCRRARPRPRRGCRTARAGP